MSIVLKRIETRLIEALKQKLSDDDLQWFRENNSKTDKSLSWFFFRLGTHSLNFERHLTDEQKRINTIARKALSEILVKEDASLSMEYLAFRRYLKSSLEIYRDGKSEESNDLTQTSVNNPIHEYASVNTDEADYFPATTEAITEQVYELLDLSILLDQKYSHLINPTVVSKELLTKDRENAIKWLQVNAIDALDEQYDTPYTAPEVVKKDVPGIGLARNFTEFFNKYRLFLARSWVLIRRLVVFLQNSYYNSLLLLANPLASMIILYVAIGFFIPRMITTIASLCKHVIPGSWMSEEEKELGFLLRLNAQWMRLWPNASNDAVWITNGLLQLLYLVGPLLPFVIFLSVATCAYDFAMASLRFALSSYRFYQLTNEYHKIAPNDLYMKDYLDNHLSNRIKQEKYFLYLGLLNFFVLMVGMGLALPWIILFNPALPLVGAVMAVTITVVNFGTQKYVTKHRADAAEQFNQELSLLLAPPSKPLVVDETPPSSSPLMGSLSQIFKTPLLFFRPATPARAPTPVTITTNLSDEYSPISTSTPAIVKKYSNSSIFSDPVDLENENTSLLPEGITQLSEGMTQ